MSSSIARGLKQVLSSRVARKQQPTRRERAIFNRNARAFAQTTLARASAAEAERTAIFALIAIGSVTMDAADCEHASWVLGGSLGRRALRPEPEMITTEAVHLIAALPAEVAEHAGQVAAAALDGAELCERSRLHLQMLRAAFDGAVQGRRDVETILKAIQEANDEFEETFGRAATGEGGLKGSVKRFFRSFLTVRNDQGSRDAPPCAQRERVASAPQTTRSTTNE